MKVFEGTLNCGIESLYDSTDTALGDRRNKYTGTVILPVEAAAAPHCPYLHCISIIIYLS